MASWGCHRPRSQTIPGKTLRSSASRLIPTTRRDGCRVPLPGRAKGITQGSPQRHPGCRCRVGWHRYSVDLQDEDPESMLNYYQGQIEMRKAEDWMENGEISDLSSNGGVLSFVKSSGGLKVMVNLNFNDRSVPMDTDSAVPK